MHAIHGWSLADLAIAIVIIAAVVALVFVALRQFGVSIPAHWYVESGEIRKDGKLRVIWIQRSDGRAAPGLYTINADGSITGVWNYGTDCEFNADGDLVGVLMSDTLRRAKEIQ